MYVCCFVTGTDDVSGCWRVYCYDGDGRELAYYMHYDNAAQADRICNDFITEKRVFDSRFWRYSFMEGCDV